MANKPVRIKFHFAPCDWADLRKHYSEREIRAILYEGAIGELRSLVQNKEEMASREPREEAP